MEIHTGPLCGGTQKRKGGCMKDHNFVPFNSFAQIRNDPVLEYLGPLWGRYSEMFAPDNEAWSKHVNTELEGFLGISFRNHGPKGDYTVARFLLPTGCIQEVHIAQGETALEAFHRWQKSCRDAHAAGEHYCMDPNCECHSLLVLSGQSL